jgi:hypothetical protein
MNTGLLFDVLSLLPFCLGEGREEPLESIELSEVAAEGDGGEERGSEEEIGERESMIDRDTFDSKGRLRSNATNRESSRGKAEEGGRMSLNMCSALGHVVSDTMR